MEYRQIGQSGIQASAITFGAWAIGGWMWGGADRKQALEAILASYENGVTSIDTAPVYGMGVSEEIVGDALKILPRDKVQVLTKFGLRWDLKEGSLHFSLDDDEGNMQDVYRYARKESVILECEIVCAGLALIISIFSSYTGPNLLRLSKKPWKHLCNCSNRERSGPPVFPIILLSRCRLLKQ
jgi:hypothetical protein